MKMNFKIQNFMEALSVKVSQLERNNKQLEEKFKELADSFKKSSKKGSGSPSNDLEKDVDALFDAIDELKERVGYNEDDIDKMAEKVKNFSGSKGTKKKGDTSDASELETIKNDIESLFTDSQEGFEKMEALEKDLKELKEKGLSAHSKDNGASEDQIKKMKSQIKDLQNLVGDEDFQDLFDQLKLKTKEMEKRLKVIETTLNSQNKESTIKQSDASTDVVNPKLEELEKKVKELESNTTKVKTMEEQHELLNKKVEEIQKSVTEVSESLQLHNKNHEKTTTSDVDAKIEEIKKQIAAIEAANEEFKKKDNKEDIISQVEHIESQLKLFEMTNTKQSEMEKTLEDVTNDVKEVKVRNTKENKLNAENIQKLEDKVKELEYDIQRHQQSQNQLEHNQRTAELDNTKSQVEEITQKILQLETHNESAQKRVLNTEDKIKEIEQRVKEVEDTKVSEGQITSLKDTISNIEQQIEGLKDNESISKIESGINAVTIKVKDLEQNEKAEIENVKGELKGISELEKRCDKLEKSQGEYLSVEDFKDFKKQFDAVKDKFKTTKHDKTNSEVREESKQQMLSACELATNFEEMKGQLESLEKEQSTFKTTFGHKFECYESELKTVGKSNDDKLTVLRESIVEKVNNLNTRIEEVKSGVDEKHDRDIKNMENKIEAIGKEFQCNGSHKQDEENKEKTEGVTNQQYQLCITQIEDIKSQISRCELHNKEILEVKSKTDEEVKTLCDKISVVEKKQNDDKQLTELKSQMETFTKRNDELQKALDKFSVKVEKSTRLESIPNNEEVEKIKKTIETMKEDQIKLEDDVDNIKTTFLEMADELEKKMNVIQKSAEEIMKQPNDSDKSKQEEKLKSIIKRLSLIEKGVNEVKRSSVDLKKSKTPAADDIEKSEKDSKLMNKLKEDFKTVKEVLKETEKELDEFKSKMSEFESTINEVKKTVENNKKESEASIKVVLSSNEKIGKDSESKRNEVMKEMDNMDTTLEEFKKRIERLEKASNKECEKRVNELSDTVKKYSETIEEIQMNCVDMKRMDDAIWSEIYLHELDKCEYLGLYYNTFHQWTGMTAPRVIFECRNLKNLDIFHLNNAICGKENIMIVIVAKDGSVFGSYNAAVIPQPTAKAAKKEEDGETISNDPKHFIFSLCNPAHTEPKAFYLQDNSNKSLCVYSPKTKDFVLSCLGFFAIKQTGCKINSPEKIYPNANVKFVEGDKFTVEFIGAIKWV
ncbi:hypothetical protein EIN_118700 [Entamoeba invadens IP1]|uniref:PARP alpha-helical domain-containing protein n=1 Tax=Entamoeba invadens IP1 TaxID=370355 RepID=L7FNR8_ENTIV|nr:hypothetical protein EIN_118700 [Entamoeba invadens IP1]ELP92266.1 hypothetical protein EIN_118700 [Entamoeba invadens IP1]|eukprot:XP_004259037.1 hypothetical protein EIN_118700 [Entamoeba invadens IP1]